MKHLHDIKAKEPDIKTWFGQMFVSTAPVNTYAQAAATFDRYGVYLTSGWRAPEYRYRQNVDGNWIVTVRDV